LTDRALHYRDLLEIIRIVEESSQFAEFRLKTGDVEIELIKAGRSGELAASASGPGVSLAGAASAVASAAPVVMPATVSVSPPALGSAPGTSGVDIDAEIAAGMQVIRSPMVGNFYRSPEPGATPFVDVGQRIDAGSVVCIIEVMKLMNSLSAETGGVVRRILAEDGQTVEYGQPLILIDPKG
jgi:acetyl-CoA carboxylase biotin carboxyl carrier protein